MSSLVLCSVIFNSSVPVSSNFRINMKTIEIPKLLARLFPLAQQKTVLLQGEIVPLDLGDMVFAIFPKQQIIRPVPLIQMGAK